MPASITVGMSGGMRAAPARYRQRLELAGLDQRRSPAAAFCNETCTAPVISQVIIAALPCVQRNGYEVEAGTFLKVSQWIWR